VDHRPHLLLVLRHARDLPRNAHRRLDYVAYFAGNPRITDQLRWYRLVEEVGEYRLFARAESTGQPGVAPRSEPGRYDLAGAERGPAGKPLATDPRLVLSALVFLGLAVGAYRVERGAAPLSAAASRRQAAG
jgi:hypothetical protein